MRFWAGLGLIVIATTGALILWPQPDRSPPPGPAEESAAPEPEPAPAPGVPVAAAPPTAKEAGGAGAGDAEVQAVEREAAAVAGGRTWIVRGHADLEPGTPAPGVALAATLHAGEDTDGTVLAEKELRTGADGRFAWPLAPPAEEVTVRVRPAPSEAHGGYGATATVTAGEAAPQELRVRIYRWDFPVTGTVMDEQSEPLAGARVRTVAHDVVTGADGRFTLTDSARRSSIYLYAQAPGYAQRRTTVNTEGREQAEANLTLVPEFPVAGRTVDESGRPVEGVVVDSFGPWKVEVESGPDGRFRLQHLDPDTRSIQIYARKEGYAQTERRLDPATGGAEDLELVMRRGARVEGRVLGPDGAPLPDAEVFVGFSTHAYDRLDATVQANGRFAVDHVAPGTRTLHVSHPGFAVHKQEVAVAEDARVVAVPDIVLTKGESVAGRVVDASGAPLADVTVSLREDRLLTDQRVQTDAQGRFLLTGLKRDRRLEVSFYESGYARHERQIEDADLGRDDFEIVLKRSGALAGRVVDAASGAPLTRFRLQFTFAEGLEDGEGGVNGISGNWYDPGLEIEAEDGIWRVSEEMLEVGRFIGVRVMAEGYSRAEIPKLRITADPDPDDLVVELSPGGTLRGVVLPAAGGAPVSGARVVRLKEDQTRRYFDPQAPDAIRVRTDANGEFALENLAAGEAWLRVDHPDWAPQVMGPVTIPEGGAPPLQRILMERGGAIHGVVRDAGGNPGSGVTVRLSGIGLEGMSSFRREVVTGGSGRFRFERLPDGTHDVGVQERVLDQTFRPVVRRVEIVDGAEVEVELAPSGTASVAGRVQWEGSLPVAMVVRMRRVEANTGGSGSAAAAEAGAGAPVAQGRASSYATVTDESGSFRFGAVESGTYDLSVFFRDGAEWHHGRERITVAEGDRAQARIVVD